MKYNIQLRVCMILFVASLCFMIPESIKAATTVTGGESMEEAVKVELEQEYTTTGTEGWFKITTPEYAKYIGVGYDKYSEMTGYNASGLKLTTGYSWSNRIPSLGEQTEYWETTEGGYAYSQPVEAEEEYYFHISTTKLNGSVFKIVCGTAYDQDERQTVKLNQDYSWYTYLEIFSGNYQFVASKTGYCKAIVSTKGSSSVSYGISYSDYTPIVSGSCNKNQESELLFQVEQGMTYYFWIEPGDDTNIQFHISDIQVSSITLNSTNLTLKHTENYLLQPYILPEKAVLKTVSYTSSNLNVATVSENGLITAVSGGTAIITCTANNGSGVYTQCTVNVPPIYVQRIDLPYTVLKLDLMEDDDDYGTITAKVYPENADNGSVSWFSSNPEVASITQEGALYLHGIGTTVITCRANDGSNVENTCLITIGESMEYGEKATIEGIKYKVTSDTMQGGTVAVTGVSSTSKKSYSIPDKVTINGYDYSIESIGNKAFSKCKKAKTITLGANIKSIGKQAFYNCKKLKTLTIKSKKLKSVGSNALKNVNAKLKVKVPKSKIKNYRKLFTNKGQKSTVTFKKM